MVHAKCTDPVESPAHVALPAGQRHAMCRLRNEIGDGLWLGHIDGVTALHLGDISDDE
jgi:hypothetical protein